MGLKITSVVVRNLSRCAVRLMQVYKIEVPITNCGICIKCSMVIDAGAQFEQLDNKYKPKNENCWVG